MFNWLLLLLLHWVNWIANSIKISLLIELDLDFVMETETKSKVFKSVGWLAKYLQFEQSQRTAARNVQSVSLSHRFRGQKWSCQQIVLFFFFFFLLLFIVATFAGISLLLLLLLEDNATAVAVDRNVRHSISQVKSQLTAVAYGCSSSCTETVIYLKIRLKLATTFHFNEIQSQIRANLIKLCQKLIKLTTKAK